MNIVRILRGPRVFVALAVVSVCLSMPTPASAVTAYAGPCVGEASLSSGTLSVRGQCIFHMDLAATLNGTGFVSATGPVGPCNVGVFSSSNYHMLIPDLNDDRLGIVVLTNTGPSATILFNSYDLKMRVYGELVSTQTSGCATKWTGVLVVDDPSLEE